MGSLRKKMVGKPVSDDEWEEEESPLKEISAPEFESTRLHNGQLEFATIVRMVIDPALRGRLWARLEESHFASDTARAIYRRLRTLAAAGIEWPTLSTLAIDPALSEAAQAQVQVVVHKAENGGSLVSTVTLPNGSEVSLAESSDFDGLVFDLLDSYRITREGTSRFVDAITEIADAEDFDPLAAPEIIERAAAEVLSVRGNEQISDNIMHFGFGTTEEDYEKREKEKKNIFMGDKPRFKTGLAGYDEKAGGFQGGEVVLLGAGTGGGKTAMAMSFMINQARAGISSAMLQLELSLQQMTERISAHLADVDSDTIRKGKCTPEEQKKIDDAWEYFQEEADQAGARMTVFTPSSMSISKCEMIFKTFPYKVWYIDYASLVSLDDSKAEGWEKLSQVTKSFKSLAKKYNITIVIGIQVNIDSDGNIEVRYAKAMKEDADVVLVWDLNQAAKDEGVVWVKHLKARQYEPFDFPVQIALQYFRFESFRDAPTKNARPRLGKRGVHKKDAVDEAQASGMFKKKKKSKELEDLDLEHVLKGTAVPSMSVIDDGKYDDLDDDDYDDDE